MTGAVRGASIAAGALVLAVIVALDVAGGGRHVFVTAFLLGPLIAAVSGRSRPVGLLAALAVLAAVVSFTWNDNSGFDYGFRIAVVLVGGLAALLTARARQRADAAAEQSHLARAQLSAVLENLAESVTVQDPSGRVVFANQAAADLLDAGGPEELVATPPEDLVARFEMVNEDGSPVRLEQLPGRRVLAGETPEPLVVRAINRRTGEERWRMTKATAVRDSEGRVRLAVNVIEDVTEVVQAERHQRLLADASAVLASSLDYNETLQQVAQMAVPGFADWCSVIIPGEGPYFDQVALAHQDPARIEFTEAFRERYPPRVDAPTGAAEVMRTGHPQLIGGITDELIEAVAQDAEHARLLKELGMRSVILVPMTAGGRTSGVLSFVAAESGRNFSEADLELALELGRRSGIAVENARLFTERSEVANSLAQGLLPPELPAMGDWTVAAHYQAAGEANAVGGDFYDAFRIGNGWMLVVGDVAGRGPAAATLTALARYTLRTAGTLTGDPLIALGTLNRALRERNRLSLCSACVVVLREGPNDPPAEVICAGHPPPFLLRDGQAAQVGTPGPMLGALDSEQWPVERTRIGAAEQLVLYTDGVIDARGRDGRFGEQRLAEVLAGALRPAEAIERVRRAMNAFQNGLQRDDVALLAVLRGDDVPARHVDLPDGPDAARAARRILEAEASGILDTRRLADARLLVSEVVTNAIRHAGAGPVRLSIAVGETSVRVEVADRGTGFDPPPARPDPELPGGRGLMLVDMLAERWGVTGDDGTCVWFEIARR